MHFTDYIFNSINGLAGKSAVLDSLMIFSSKILPYIFMLSLVAIFIFGIIKKDTKSRGAIVDTIILTAINIGLSFIIGHICYFPRPFLNNSSTNLLYSHIPDSSFPSDHALGSMSIALGLNRYNKMLGRISILLSILIGISRVYVGHHYPLDVIGSFIIAIGTSYLYKRIMGQRLQDIYFKIEKRIPILNKLVK